MNKLKIAVICGGNSPERQVSLGCGLNVFNNLDRSKYEPFLIEVDEDLRWQDTTSNQSVELYSTQLGINYNLKDKYDLAFLAMPGSFGEDGQLQSILDMVGLPYTHSGRLSSAMTMDKATTASLVDSVEILTPKTLQFNSSSNIESIVDQILNTFQYPIFIKPNNGGSSINTYKIIEELELWQALQELAKDLPNISILAQECINGRELTCAVMGNNDGTVEALMVGEIITGAEFFDYNAKYFDASTEEIFPAQIDIKTENRIKQMSVLAHQILKCDGLTRSDFILTKSGEIYFLEINTNPGMAQASLSPKIAKILYGSVSVLLDKIIDLALIKFQIYPFR